MNKNNHIPETMFLLVVYYALVFCMFLSMFYLTFLSMNNTQKINETCQIACDIRRFRIIDDECYCVTSDGWERSIMEINE